MINNYTRAPEGLPNLNLSVFYDADEASILFDENFNALKRDGRFGVYFFTDCGNETTPETLKDIFDVSKFSFETLKDIFTESNLWDNETREEMIAEVSDFKTSELSIDYLIQLFSENESDYGYAETRGYSQGDYSVVIFKKSEILPDFNHYFWDCPIYARLFVDGEEYCLDEHLTDLYEYNRESIISGFFKAYNGPEKEYVAKWLSNNLPEYLEAL